MQWPCGGARELHAADDRLALTHQGGVGWVYIEAGKGAT